MYPTLNSTWNWHPQILPYTVNISVKRSCDKGSWIWWIQMKFIPFFSVELSAVSFRLSSTEHILQQTVWVIEYALTSVLCKSSELFRFYSCTETKAKVYQISAQCLWLVYHTCFWLSLIRKTGIGIRVFPK